MQISEINFFVGTTTTIILGKKVTVYFTKFFIDVSTFAPSTENAWPGCSKRTASLVNVPLKFQTLIS